MVTAFIIGLFSFLLDLSLVKLFLIRFELLIVIPILSILFTLTISIPCSTILNYIAFKYGLDPNNIVSPIMTAIDDFSTVICFYTTIILLGVP